MPVLPHIETSQLICTANELTCFYMRATLALNGLNKGKKRREPQTLITQVKNIKGKYGNILTLNPD